jgi:FtsZ-interacting cell division protein ZipA
MCTSQADEALAWWNFVVGLVAALGTVAAVVFAVWSSRKADKRAMEAQADAALAREDAKADRARAQAADERAVGAAERQAAASEGSIATELEHERERRAYARQTEVERKALRQAVDVDYATEWLEPQEGDEPLEHNYARIRVVVLNKSALPLHDVVVRLQTTFHRDEEQFGRAAVIDAESSKTVLEGPRFMPSVPWGYRLHATIAFTDAFGDRWQQASEGSLTLQTMRVIKMAPLNFEDQL